MDGTVVNVQARHKWLIYTMYVPHIVLTIQIEFQKWNIDVKMFN